MKINASTLFSGLLAVMIVGCSAADSKLVNKRTPLKPATSSDAVEKTASEPQPTDLVGLPDYCSIGSEARRCIECKPREFPIRRCFAAADGFDAQKACHHDDAGVSCEIGSGKTLSISAAKSNEETTLEKVDSLSANAKALFASRIKTDKAHQFADEMVGLFQTRARDILTGANKDQVVADVVDVLKRVFPTMSQQDLENRRQVASGTIDLIVRLREDSVKFGEPQVVQVLVQVYGLMPSDIMTKLLAELNPQDIVKALSW